MVYPNTCPNTLKSDNRFSVKHANRDWQLNGYFQGGDYYVRGLGETQSLANLDNANARQVAKAYGEIMPRQNQHASGYYGDYGNAYGNMSWQYINQDNYNGKFDHINDVERVKNSAHMPYVIPDVTQRPKYQWQNNYSAWRDFSVADLYKNDGPQSKASYSKINSTKNENYKQRYR
jgi:hypothetical protein